MSNELSGNLLLGKNSIVRTRTMNIILIVVSVFSVTFVRALVIERPTADLSPKKEKQQHGDIFQHARELQREKIFQKACYTKDEFTPCACRVVFTNTEVSYKDEMRRVEFAEYPCDEKENKRRATEGIASSR